MTKINYKYENKRLVEINSKNVNSSFIKNIINFIELRHENLFLKFSEKSKELWKRELPFIGSAPPKIYSVKEDQFIIVQSTGSDSLRTGYQIKMGDALVAFKLKK